MSDIFHQYYLFPIIGLFILRDLVGSRPARVLFWDHLAPPL